MPLPDTWNRTARREAVHEGRPHSISNDGYGPVFITFDPHSGYAGRYLHAFEFLANRMLGNCLLVPR